jgi:hypothetical protein
MVTTYFCGSIDKQHVVAVRIVLWPLQHNVVKVWQLISSDFLNSILQMRWPRLLIGAMHNLHNKAAKHLDFKPAPWCMYLAKILFHKCEGG